MTNKVPKRKRSFWRAARRAFRWFRITVWFGVLALLILAIWLHRVGLPDFIKDPLVAELRLRGLDVRFTRMRLIWYRGIVADNIQFGRPGTDKRAARFRHRSRSAFARSPAPAPANRSSKAWRCAAAE